MESSISCTFEIIVGTYEEFVLGYIFDEESKKLSESFSIHSHQGSIRCISATSNFVASGGSDDIIQLYNMITRKGAGTIMHHTGTVSSLKFTPEQCHLISGSHDGSIAVFRVGSWQLEKNWDSAHKDSGVCSIDIHPSNKLALSLGQNKTLRTWNLIKGRPAYTSNLSNVGKYVDLVVWSTRGTYYVVSVDNKIHIFDMNIAGIISTVQHTSRVTCICFLENHIVCSGEENGCITCYDITSNLELWKIKVGPTRVKCISSVSSKWIITANSDGQIIVWEINNFNNEPNQITSINAGCRITCLDVRIPAKIEII